MKRSRKLSDLLFDKPKLVIKNRQELLLIYDEYLQCNYISMVNWITKYDDNPCRFFVDLLILLKDKYKNEDNRYFIYSHIWDLYHEKLNIQLI